MRGELTNPETDSLHEVAEYEELVRSKLYRYWSLPSQLLCERIRGEIALEKLRA